MPQWSRPVMGGNTRSPERHVTDSGRPQWSRPVMGGNTSAAPASHGTPGGAAMEPPGNGRKHAPAPSRSGCGPSGAAMEPPGNGRKHAAPASALPGSLVAAAMEPPGNGRKHVLVDFGDTFDLIAPQWSRPVMGGNTRTRQSANQLIR